MPIYQCIKESVVTFNYDRVHFVTNQLVNIDSPTISQHPNFRQIKGTPELIKRTPKLNQIIEPPIEPHYMSHDDIRRELATYKISTSPYEMSDVLVQKLMVARSMFKRNHITIINDMGQSIWVDHFDPNEYAEKPPTEEEKSTVIDTVKDFFHKIRGDNDNDDDPMSIAAVESGNIDFPERLETDMSELIRIKMDREQYRTKVDKELKVEGINLEEDTSPTPSESEIPIRGDEINISLLEEFIETKPCILEQIDEMDHDELQLPTWAKTNMYVYETFLRSKDIYFPEVNKQRRTHVLAKVKEFYEETIHKDEMVVKLNLLQKRYEEIKKKEPDYRKSTERALRMKLTEMANKYGYEIILTKKMKQSDLRRYVRKVFGMMKLGKKIEEEGESTENMDAFLTKSGHVDLVRPRTERLKDNKNKTDTLENINNNKEL